MYQWFDLDDGRKVYRKVCAPHDIQRSSLPIPMFISDQMDPTEHVDGNYYTSKSAYRRVTKERGYVEIGNDPARFRAPSRPKADRKAKRDAIERADYMVRNGIKP